MQLLSDQITNQELNVVLDNFGIIVSQNISGDVVEFGCYVGTTSVHLQKICIKNNKTLHVYDSFEGLPDKSNKDDSPAGIEFKKGELFASKKELIKNFKKANLPLPIIHKGWFSEIKPKDVPNVISFAFLDGDFYDSIYDSLKIVVPNMQKGGLILVHDYGRATLPGAKKAVQDFLASNKSVSFVRSQEHIAILKKL
jgi:O-methyltransferase